MIVSSFVGKIHKANHDEFELHINALGFESRCLEIVKNRVVVANNTLFLQFPDSEMFSFKKNIALSRSVKETHIVRYGDEKFLSNIKQIVEGKKYKSISIDISSMNRTMIAAVLSCIAQTEAGEKLRIYYAPRKFKEDKVELSDIVSAGPVLPEFSAFDDESDLPMASIMSVGMEYGVAQGLVNVMEPKVSLFLSAKGYKKEFEGAVLNANTQFRFNGVNASVVHYQFIDVCNTYRFISQTIGNLVGTHRVTLIPLGPKMLASMFVLATIQYLGKVALWRIVRNVNVEDVEADGNYISFDIDWPMLSSSKIRYDSLFSI